MARIRGYGASTRAEFLKKRRERTARLRNSNWLEKMVDWVQIRSGEKTESLPEGQEVRIEWGEHERA